MQRLEFLHVSRFALIASINRVGVSNKVHWVIPGEWENKVVIFETCSGPSRLSALSRPKDGCKKWPFDYLRNCDEWSANRSFSDQLIGGVSVESHKMISWARIETSKFSARKKAATADVTLLKMNLRISTFQTYFLPVVLSRYFFLFTMPTRNSHSVCGEIVPDLFW